MQDAKNARIKLGGDNLHLLQINNVSVQILGWNQYGYHNSCYKKLTKVVSIRNKCFVPLEKPTCTRRSGELGKTLFPDHCMLSKRAHQYMSSKEEISK